MFNPAFITSNLTSLTKQERIVAEYALHKGFELIDASINKIVKDTKTSLATVNRTFAKMGYTGYKYYKMFLFANLKINNSSNDELDFQKSHLLLSLENTYSVLDYAFIDKAAEAIIKNKGGITFLCEGFNYYVAKILGAKLAKLGFACHFFDDNLYSGALSTNLLIVISTKMSNHSIYQKLNIIKNNNPNIEVIVITTNAVLKNKYEYDQVLTGAYINNFRMNDKELPSDSLVLLLVICNYVFDRIYAKNKLEYDHKIDTIKW